MSTNTDFVPAPVPQVNVWEQRRNATVAQPTMSNQAPPTTSSVVDRAPTSAQPSQPAKERISHDDGAQEVSGGTGNDFLDMVREMNKLNKKLNIRNVTAAIAHLNKLIEPIDDPFAMLGTVQHFTANILPQYNILNV